MAAPIVDDREGSASVPLMDELHLQRARSFGDVAEAYQQARPTYPQSAVEWVLAAAPGRDVLDLAAGTGKLTRVILETGAAVVAVEPLDGMRAQLEHAYPAVPAYAGSAEQIPLEAASVDAVLVGQAFHWFDTDRALAEIDRVLRPGGVLGLLWNIRDDSIGWVAELSGSLAVGADLLSQVDGSDWAPVQEHARFTSVERRDFANPTAFDAERLVTWAASTSHFATMEPRERERTLEAVREFALRHPGLGDSDHFTMPFVTVTARARIVQR
jgi:SAM-dependent methyltransferase